MKKLMEIENLEVTFPDHGKELRAVRGISFELYEGEALALVGESGCGKSVTARAMMGLLPGRNRQIGEQSQIRYKGKNILGYTDEEWNRYCGEECAMIFQDAMAALNPTQTVGAQIAENLVVHRSISKSEAMQEAVRMLKEVGISNPGERVKQYPHEFSGGMRQRSMIAMAMICHPKILIADEPTTALDVTIRAQILSLMKRLKEKNKMSLLLITHDLGIVAGMADRTAVMYAGKIVEIGDSRLIYYDTRHPYTYSLLRAVPRLDMEKGKKLMAIEGMPPKLTEPQKGCPFAARCLYCMEVCMEEEPPIYMFGDGHQAACWLHDPQADTSGCEFQTGGERVCQN